MLIAFEGLDQAGKSSIIKEFKKYLDFRQIDNYVTREPGILGKEYRNVLLNNKIPFTADGPIIESLFFAYDRIFNSEKTVIPNLQQNKVVIIDRFVDSTLVYQGNYYHKNNLSFNALINFQDKLINHKWPDLTFIIDITPEESIRRMKKVKIINNFDLKSKQEKALIRQKYLDLPKYFPNRKFVTINAMQDLEKVVASVVSEFENNYQKN